MPDIAPVQLGRIALTNQQLRATEIALYRAADLIDRILADNGVQYTKVELPAPPQAPLAALPPGLPYGPPAPPLGPAPVAPPPAPPVTWPQGGQ